jgi:alpha-galactosidase
MAKKDLGHSEHSRPVELSFGPKWTVFGPVERDAQEPDFSGIAGCPAALTVGKRKLSSKKVNVRDEKLDLTQLYGPAQEGRTAYVFIPVTAPKTGEYRIGIGADWWFSAWVDGKAIGDTLANGNGIQPPSKHDNELTVCLDAGEHTLAVKVISGSVGTVLAVGVPARTGMSKEESTRARHLGISSHVLRPIKVVFLGAGSGFLQTLATDVMSIPGADRGEFALVDIDPVRLELAEQVCRKIVETMGTKWKITATADRRKVLKGADYVINCIEVSGVDCINVDHNIPFKYGIDQCIGDTMGPGGLFKAMRTVPVFVEVLRDVERLCPQAWVLNYTNPMSIMCLAAARASKVKVVGLCHSVQSGSHQLAAWAGVAYHRLKWNCAGVNHLAWFTELSLDGVDLYPRIKERFLTEKNFNDGKDKVRLDLMMHFGFYCTEMSGHDSEYLPYYRKTPAMLKRYCGEGWEGGSRYYASAWPGFRKSTDQHRRDVISGKEPLKMERSWEYASYIIQAMETNAGFVIYGNMPNHGVISNLPQDGVVEVACLVDRFGIRPTHYGRLPSQCAALCDWNMRFFDLAADACLTKSIETAAHALMLDPLSAAVSCPADIRKMTFELFEAEKEFLPGFRP